MGLLNQWWSWQWWSIWNVNEEYDTVEDDKKDDNVQLVVEAGEEMVTDDRQDAEAIEAIQQKNIYILLILQKI